MGAPISRRRCAVAILRAIAAQLRVRYDAAFYAAALRRQRLIC